MINDLLDGRGEMVIGTVLGEDKKNLGAVAQVQAIAGLGRLEKYQEMGDGRFMIVLLGQRRVRVEAYESERPYPTARVFDLDDQGHPVEMETRKRLREALIKFRVAEKVPDHASDVQLADILLMGAQVSEEERYEVFSTFPVNQRIHRVLELMERSSPD